jgi:N utilization substance protein A
MGARVRNVVAELHGEKIDIVDWSDDPAAFIAQALSPAEVISVEVVDAAARAARVVVPDYQLSLAIGREGQNARLAARLTGWRIDIRSDAAGDAPGAAGGAPGAAGGSGAPPRPAGAPLRGSSPRPRPTTSAPRIAR